MSVSVGTDTPKDRASRESETREVWRPLGSGIGLATKPHRPVIEYWRIRRKEVTSLLTIALNCARKTFGCTLCSPKPQAVFGQKPRTDLDQICRASAPTPNPLHLGEGGFSSGKGSVRYFFPPCPCASRARSACTDSNASFLPLSRAASSRASAATWRAASLSDSALFIRSTSR